MEAGLVARAIAATTALAAALGLRVDDVVVLHDSNRLALHLLPCDVVARVGPAGQGVPALEVRVAQQLARVEAPVAVLDPRIAPRVHEADGFAVTFWTHYEAVAADRDSPADYAEALRRLHAGMRRLEIDAPHFMERTAAAEWLLSNPDRSPALAEDDRRLLLDTLDSARLAIGERGAPEQLLHGEPHQGNLLRAQGGPLFIDFETCCRGPVEFDVAHLPAEASAHYPEVDERLLSECRRLVLAMVAAWRWDVDDEFPDGHRHGQNILDILREGPPWRPLGDLSGD